MNLLADESVDAALVDRLRADGHEVAYVAEMSAGLPDDSVLDHANRRGALLLTADKDFGELVFRLRRTAQGVILARLAGLSAPLKAQVVSDALRIHGKKMRGAFSVITPGAVRIRSPR